MSKFACSDEGTVFKAALSIVDSFFDGTYAKNCSLENNLLFLNLRHKILKY